MACEAEVSGVFAEADQECFAPGGGVVDVIIVQVFHVFRPAFSSWWPG